MRGIIRKIIKQKQKETIRSILDLIKLDDINYIDVGSVDPILNRLHGAENIINYFGFDVNKDDKNFNEFKSYKKLNNILYSENTSVNFYHNYYNHTSSIYKPSVQFLNRYEKLTDPFKLVKMESCEAIKLDSLKIQGINYLKLDTQGSELDILKGSHILLDKTISIEIEIEFDEIYEKQPLFDDIFKFLFDSGFELIDFTHISRITEGNFENNIGKLISVDAVFFRKPNLIQNEKMIEAYVLACALYNKYEIAISFLKKKNPNSALLKHMDKTFEKSFNENSFIKFILKLINLLTLKNNKFYKMPNY